MTAREDEREDLEDEDDEGLNHIEGGRVPQGYDPRVEYVNAGVPKDARRVPRDLGDLKEEGGAVEGDLGIFVYPKYQLCKASELVSSMQVCGRAGVCLT